MVLVDEVVAVEHVDSLPWRISGNNPHNFAGCDPNHVLHTSSFIWHHCVPSASARDDLEVNEMDMDRVRSVATSVSQLPDLVLTEDRSRQDAVFNVCPANTVDDPLTVNTGKGKVLGDVGLRWRRDVVHIGGKRLVFYRLFWITDDESHNAVSRGVVEGSSHAALVEHGDVLAPVVSKVHDNFVSFTLGDGKVGRWDWMRKET